MFQSRFWLSREVGLGCGTAVWVSVTVAPFATRALAGGSWAATCPSTEPGTVWLLTTTWNPFALRMVVASLTDLDETSGTAAWFPSDTVNVTVLPRLSLLPAPGLDVSTWPAATGDEASERATPKPICRASALAES